MTIDMRTQMLRTLGSDVHQIHLTVPEVREIDDYLVKDWGIDLARMPEEQQFAELLETLSPNMQARFVKINRQRLNAEAKGRYAPALEREVYDILAEPSLGGIALSDRRTYILDSMAHVLVLARKLDIEGPILDLGCHLGYLPLFLAAKCPNRVMGVDLSPKAIACAQQRSAGMGNLSFGALDYTTDEMDERFELITAVDSILPNQCCMRAGLNWISDHLQPGGVAVLVGNLYQVNESAMTHYLKLNTLGCGLVDRVGGWIEPAAGFSWKAVLVLVKGDPTPLPRNAFSQWAPEFVDYANAPETPWREKTQAYFRAKLADPVLKKQRVIREAMDSYSPELMMAGV